MSPFGPSLPSRRCCSAHIVIVHFTPPLTYGPERMWRHGYDVWDEMLDGRAHFFTTKRASNALIDLVPLLAIEPTRQPSHLLCGCAPLASSVEGDRIAQCVRATPTRPSHTYAAVPEIACTVRISVLLRPDDACRCVSTARCGLAMLSII